jgi:hypothetical protein
VGLYLKEGVSQMKTYSHEPELGAEAAAAVGLSTSGIVGTAGETE